MAALDKSIYEEIIVTSSSGKSVDIAPGTVMIDYYEDLFSPVITAKLQIINEGYTITGDDGTLQTIYNGLPLSCAGYLNFSETLKILRIRGDAMQNCVPKGEGGMVGMNGEGMIPLVSTKKKVIVYQDLFLL